MTLPRISQLLPCLLAALLAAVPAGAAETQLFSLSDVKGDDDGSGALIFPNRPDLQPGDLDLVGLSAVQRSDGIWFIVEFKLPIHGPGGLVTELGQIPLDRLARLGFYTFNVDVYIDTDRIAGSGNTRAIPGRGVAIDRNFAWEKCIVLTPRPGVAQTMLQLTFDSEMEAEVRAKQGKISKEEVEDVQARSEMRVNDLYFFPTKVRVSGNTVEFFVPAEFLGGIPHDKWAYSVVVTGADLDQTGRPAQISPAKPTMFTLPVGQGISFSMFGIRSDTDSGTPPVADILSSDPAVQARVLTDYDAVAGRLAAIPGTAPDGKAATTPTGEVLTAGEAAKIEATTGAANGGGSTAGAGTAERRTVPARLRTLNQLLADGLITQAEYNELRRKILAEL
jgi:hypothetical protein